MMQAARDLNVLRRWIREAEDNPQSTFPHNGQMKPEQQEIERLHCGLAIISASVTDMAEVFWQRGLAADKAAAPAFP